MVLNTNANLTPEEIVNLLVGTGITFSNVQITGSNQAIGSFSGGISEGLGLESGVIMSSGNIADAAGPNDDDGTGQTLGTPGDSDLNALLEEQTTMDAVVLEFNFVPENEQFIFEYVFASEEYNEFANSAFNDIFAFFLNGENIALIPGTTTPVAINNINATDNEAFFRNNDPSDIDGDLPFNTEFDGFTTVFAAQSFVTPGVEQTLKLVIADTTDGILDSAVFLNQGSLSTLGASPDAVLSRNSRDIFSIEDTEGFAILKFTLEEVNTDLINEIGIFVVDDDQGSIGGVLPGEPDYEQLALTGVRSRAIFVGLPDDLSSNRERLLRDFTVGQQIGFYLIANGTTDGVLFDAPLPPFTPGPQTFFAFPEANPDGEDHLQVSENNGTFTLSWEDELNGSSFDDLVMTVETVIEDFPEGTRLQGQIQREILDFTNLPDGETLDLSFNTQEESAFNNVVGLYRIEDAQGTVINPLNGEEVTPDQAGYAQAAIRQRVVEVNESGNVTGDTSLSGFLAPFIIANGTPEEWLEENPNNAIFGEDTFAYFPYLEANPDGFDHIVLLEDNTFGFEDLPSNSDFDYNDFILEIIT